MSPCNNSRRGRANIEANEPRSSRWPKLPRAKRINGVCYELDRTPDGKHIAVEASSAQIFQEDIDGRSGSSILDEEYYIGLDKKRPELENWCNSVVEHTDDLVKDSQFLSCEGKSIILRSWAPTLVMGINRQAWWDMEQRRSEIDPEFDAEIPEPFWTCFNESPSQFVGTTADAEEREKTLNIVKECMKRYNPAAKNLIRKPVRKGDISGEYINAYLRRAERNDAKGMTEIWNYDIQNELTSYKAVKTVQQMRTRMRKIFESGLPCMVAVRRARTVGDNEKASEHEEVVGFVCAEEYGSKEGPNRYIATLSLHVHHDYRQQRLGSCLLENLFVVFDRKYRVKQDYPYPTSGPAPVDSKIGLRPTGTLLLVLPSASDEHTKNIVARNRALEKYHFVQAGHLSRVAACHGKAVDIDTFQRTFKVDMGIEDSGTPSRRYRVVLNRYSSSSKTPAIPQVTDNKPQVTTPSQGRRSLQVTGRNPRLSDSPPWVTTAKDRGSPRQVRNQQTPEQLIKTVDFGGKYASHSPDLYESGMRPMTFGRPAHTPGW